MGKMHEKKAKIIPMKPKATKLIETKRKRH